MDLYLYGTDVGKGARRSLHGKEEFTRFLGCGCFGTEAAYTVMDLNAI